MNNFCGAIYILTNPSFPDYVKIGYSKNVEERLNRLNDSEAVPFAFRLYPLSKTTPAFSLPNHKARLYFQSSTHQRIIYYFQARNEL